MAFGTRWRRGSALLAPDLPGQLSHKAQCILPDLAAPPASFPERCPWHSVQEGDLVGVSCPSPLDPPACCAMGKAATNDWCLQEKEPTSDLTGTLGVPSPAPSQLGRGSRSGSPHQPGCLDPGSTASSAQPLCSWGGARLGSCSSCFRPGAALVLSWL